MVSRDAGGERQRVIWRRTGERESVMAKVVKCDLTRGERPRGATHRVTALCRREH